MRSACWKQPVDLRPVAPLQPTRPAAPRQRHGPTAVVQGQRAQRTVRRLLRIVQDQHTPPGGQPLQTDPCHRGVDAGHVPVRVGQDAPQAALDGVGVGRRAHPPQLSRQPRQGCMPCQQQPSDQQREASAAPDAKARNTHVQLLAEPLIEYARGHGQLLWLAKHPQCADPAPSSGSPPTNTRHRLSSKTVRI